jgi:DUF1365 family protein
VLNANAKDKSVEWGVDKERRRISASWNKEFHVSPFMEMDYRYTFTFSAPGQETIHVSAKMVKQSTQELWFTASFVLDRIAFSPWNLLYVLLYYPLHTRLIQVCTTTITTS